MTRKELNFLLQALIVINLFLSMIYTCAVDSLSNFDIIFYAAILGGLWYVVKLVNDKVESMKDDEKISSDK